ncbi:hypothetical protein Goklo_029027 [Gossypium klotzschianum]|uniref:Uncharacterized protein n=1 Tax=Gossypium klotzschianum TaxID=34286 RepID=A0A7J8W600_9ROSI|nr:hypothetical protein [Gossypium klotzschianum]
MMMALKEETMATMKALSARIEELGRKSLWGQGLHTMWTISCGGWKLLPCQRHRGRCG